ncbi:response regulator transcription factor [Nocardioides sp. NBC_00163]|uniref:response regulator n=1 Tax=Nocardioides sp. NBC_00163 TaxID=2975999 RepID=UPI00324F4AF3
MTIGVLVADDQDLVRAGFASILDAQPDITVIAEAGDGEAAVALARRFRPDVALLDVRMPGTDGLEAARLICAESETRVIMLTTFDVDSYVYEALRVGASGFLLKDVRRDDLIHAVRVVAAGEALLAPSVTRRLITEFSRVRTVPAAAPSEPGLTPREQETLVLIARGLSNAEIAAALVVSTHTAKTHVSNVLGKLGLRDRVQATIHAYETGVVTLGAEPGAPGPHPIG